MEIGDSDGDSDGANDCDSNSGYYDYNYNFFKNRLLIFWGRAREQAWTYLWTVFMY